MFQVKLLKLVLLLLHFSLHLLTRPELGLRALRYMEKRGACVSASRQGHDGAQSKTYDWQ
jgi:hypothetical protein